MRVTRFNPQTDEPLWPGIMNPDWDKRAEDLYGYNPVKAKKLLEEAGYKNGFEFTGWDGECGPAGKSETCTITMDHSWLVVAKFTAK